MTNATMPSGTLIRKIHGQLATETIQPPRAGASTGASSAGQVRYAVASSRSRFAVARRTTSRPTGTIIAPPMPCRIRATTSIHRLLLTAQSAEATVNVAMAQSSIRRPPNRSVSQPLTGIPMAMVTRYAVIAMLMSIAATPRSAAIAGAAVAMIVPSRFSMKKVPATSSASGRFSWLRRRRAGRDDTMAATYAPCGRRSLVVRFVSRRAGRPGW